MSEAAAFQPAQILAVLDRHQVAYVLIGGYAAQLHGSTLADHRHRRHAGH